MSVVDTQQTKDRQEDTGTHADRTAYFERVEVAEVVPRVAPFGEGQYEYGRLVVQHHRMSQLQLVRVVNRASRVAGDAHVGSVRNDHAVGVATHGDDFRPLQEVEAHHAVATQLKALEGRLPRSAGV